MTQNRSRTHRTARSALAVVAALTLTAATAACGDEDGDDDPTTTTAASSDTTEATGGAGGAGADSEFLAEAEERGKPTLEATDDVDELVVTDDVDGSGATVEDGDVITAHYVGVSASSGEEFDSSWDRGQPATFPLTGVIEGWSEGLVGMQEGGRRTLVIPADMAYGDTPPPGSGIEPGATLVFTVDLISID